MQTVKTLTGLCVSDLGLHCLPMSFLWEGWMTLDFTSFLTVFQLYQDDGWMIMEGCVCNGKSFTVEKTTTASGTRIRDH